MATTRPDHEDPALRSRVYPGDFHRVWSAAEASIAALGRCRLIAREPEQGTLRCEASSPLGVRDTVELHVLELETGEVQVDGTVAAKAPLALGAGRRTLKALLHELDGRLDRSGTSRA